MQQIPKEKCIKVYVLIFFKKGGIIEKGLVPERCY